MTNGIGDFILNDYCKYNSIDCLGLQKYYSPPPNTIKTIIFGGGFYNNKKELIYIKRIIYSNPAVIIFWSDKTKTVAKCNSEDNFSVEAGIAIATLKKTQGNAFVKKLFKDWAVSNVKERTLSDVRKDNK